jgi:isocitrate/isopropylmalate dehydrogenase
MMLEFLGEAKAAAALMGAIEQVCAQGETLTADLGGSATTTQATDAILKQL